jgi:hypothetical protein
MITTPPQPDPPPAAHHRKATVSGDYWIDVNVYVGDHLVQGVKGRCHITMRGRRCFIIRVK